jgi:hypothetical protein
VSRTLVPETFTDISLDGWLDVRAKGLIAAGKVPCEWYCEHSHEALAAPRRLGGAVLFDTKLDHARINYSAADECKLSHTAMAEIEALLSTPVAYFRP